MTTTRRMVMLAFPDCQMLDVTGPLQMFAGANEALGTTAYDIVLAAPVAGAFATSSGMRLVADAAFPDVARGGFAPSDTVIAAGGDKGVRTALRNGHVTALVRRAAEDGARIVSVCTGAFFLAAAGVLDGRRAATHWRAAGRLREFRPQVRVDAESIYVRDGDVWTSAGVTAGIDLALAIIAVDFGAETALTVARANVVFPIRPGGQSQFSAVLAASGVRHRGLSRLAERIAERPADDWRTEMLAAEAGVSLRSLSRLFRKELNDSPSSFVERVRIDRARQALLRTDAPIESIAQDCGFGSLRRMDRAFARGIATTPSEFRDRFRVPGAVSSQRGETPCPSSTLVS